MRYKNNDYEYTISYVRTRTDEVVSVQHTRKQALVRSLIRKHFGVQHVEPDLQNTDECVYIKDSSFQTGAGLARLDAIRASGIWIDPVVFAARGIDYEIWRDYYVCKNQEVES